MDTKDSTSLDQDDIQVLLEALKAWEDKDLSTEIMSTVMGSVFARSDEERAEWERKDDERKRKAEHEKAWRKERSILLQAKLIGMRNQCSADAFVVSSLGGRS